MVKPGKEFRKTGDGVFEIALTAAELEDIREKVSRVKRSNVFDSTKRQYAGALEFIEKVRKGEAV